MSEIIDIHWKSDVHMLIDCDLSILHDISDAFSFQAEGYKFHPKFKAKVWDGKIRLMSTSTRLLYVGLLPHLLEFARRNGYEVNVDPRINMKNDITPKDMGDYMNSLNIHSDGEPIHYRNYQYYAVWYALTQKRTVLQSPTSSGKSSIIYAASRWFLDNEVGKILIVVPTVSLVTQMRSDFIDYSSNVEWDADSNIHTISSGADKESDKKIFISTWQSIYKMPKQYFSQFKMIIGDEAHSFKAKSLGDIMSKLSSCPYRIGTTGTTGSKTINKLTLQGMFGTIKSVISTKELMDRGQIAKLHIEIQSIIYNDDEKKAVKKMDYQQEIDWILKHEKRNQYISNLTCDLKGNNLLLFLRVAHGKELKRLIDEKIKGTNRKVFLIYGGTDKEVREEIRHIVEKEIDAIIIASFGTFSTGVNIKNINNVIFGSPSKSEIRVLQSIGRGLRKSKTKDSVVLYDIVDDLSWKKYKNYTLKHFIERLNIYSNEKFDYTLSKILF